MSLLNPLSFCPLVFYSFSDIISSPLLSAAEAKAKDSSASDEDKAAAKAAAAG